MLKIKYEELPVIVTLEKAIEQKSFYDGFPIKEASGSLDFSSTTLTIEGSFRTGKQEHFYLEPHTCLALPRDSNELEIFCSTQYPKIVQAKAAVLLDLPESMIAVRVKRIGGGFGGKETRVLVPALPTVFAAHTLQRPVRCTLTRDEDMIVSGTRHPLLFNYKCWYSPAGMLLGLDVQVYINAGCTMDYSSYVLKRAMKHVQNAYNIPNVRVQGWVCRTNTVSNTAFRGFGSPQGIMVAEQIVRAVARQLNRDYIEIMDLNLYREGHLTFYNQKILRCNVERCFKEVIESSNFSARRNEVDRFNRETRWRKRGITVVPTVFGVGFPYPFMNQAGALVNINTDGSVLVTTGGVEMGQGLHTKLAQVAARVLEIPIAGIYLSEVATDKVPNPVTTAGSTSSDLNGPAVLEACQILKQRLAPYKEEFPQEDWKSWVNRAFLDRVHLSATGFFKQNETIAENAFYYYSYGAACTEVEVDCLTGEHQVRRVDIIMDVGSSLNPAIDIGQIEGAFVQGS